MEPDSMLRCSICTTTFSRGEHLQRHMTSHGTGRPYECKFCGRAFKRRDVLTRHWKTCKPYLTSGVKVPELSSHSRGQKRRACDRCVRLKKACSFEYPCESCVTRQQSCSYERLLDLDEASGPNLLLSPPHAAERLFSGNRKAPLRSGNGYDDRSVARIPAGPLELNTSISSLSTPEQDMLADLPSQIDWVDWDLNPAVMSPSLNAPIGFVQTGGDRLRKLEFLTRFTTSTGFSDSFECGTYSQRQQVAWELAENQCNDLLGPVLSSGDAPTLNGLGLGLSSGHVDGGHSSVRGENETTRERTLSVNGNGHVLPQSWTDIADNYILQTPRGDLGLDHGVAMKDSHWKTWLSDPLAMTAHGIVERLKGVISSKSENSVIKMTWSPFIEELCFQFFAPHNLRRFLQLFWSLWYPNCPIIHKPTFSAEEPSPTLIAAMAVIGACLSPHSQDNSSVKPWFDIVEEMAFSDEWFREYPVSGPFRRSDGRIPRHKRLELLQAVYMVCLFQNWEGSEEAKRRIRRYRYAAVVTAARNFDISTATHKYLQADTVTQSWWHHFVAEEQLIRTITYVFLLDTGFAIFYNSPPRMVIAELQMDLVCPEACFQARSAEDSFAHYKNWVATRPWKGQFSLSAAVRKICQANLSPSLKKDFVQMSTLNTFAIITSMHSLIFHLHTAGVEPNTMPLEQGLTNWQHVWDERTSSLTQQECYDYSTTTPGNMWMCIGFMQHAPEFWLLARIILDRLFSLKSVDDGLESGNVVLEKYDEFDMKQINGLIQEFQKLNLAPIIGP